MTNRDSGQMIMVPNDAHQMMGAILVRSSWSQSWIWLRALWRWKSSEVPISPIIFGRMVMTHWRLNHACQRSLVPPLVVRCGHSSILLLVGWGRFRDNYHERRWGRYSITPYVSRPLLPCILRCGSNVSQPTINGQSCTSFQEPVNKNLRNT